MNKWFLPQTIRLQCQRIFDLSMAGKTNFELNINALPKVARFVQNITDQNYPDGKIPYHGRFNHLNAGEVARTEYLKKSVNGGEKEKAKSLIDLVFISVLVDAGAGPEWSFTKDEKNYSRSEGLGVASFDLFLDPAVSSNYSLRPDLLKNLTIEKFANIFQVSPSNPLLGLEQRVELLNKLGELLENDKETFPNGRPGDIFDQLPAEFEVEELFLKVLTSFHKMWPVRQKIDGINLSDIWEYSFEGQKDLIPFHKLSQWLTYSLVEIFETAGKKVNNLDGLTGLPEYRNGGLFIDLGAIKLRDKSQQEQVHEVNSALIIEWRALTIILLDQLAEILRTQTKNDAKTLPLVKILEGGTWASGRELAKKRNGQPPLKIKLDSSVF